MYNIVDSKNSLYLHNRTLYKIFLIVDSNILKTSCMCFHFRYRENLFITSSNFLNKYSLYLYNIVDPKNSLYLHNRTLYKVFLIFTNFLYAVSFLERIYSLYHLIFDSKSSLSTCTKCFLLFRSNILKTSCMQFHLRYKENLFITSSNFLTQRILSTCTILLIQRILSTMTATLCTKLLLLFRTNDFTNFLYVVKF